MSKSVIFLVEEIDKFRYSSEIQVKDEISSSTKSNWNSLSKFHPSEVVVFEFNLTRSSEIIDLILFSNRKPVVVRRSELFDGIVDTLMHKVVDVTKEALRSMRAPDVYLPDTVSKIFDMVRSLEGHMNNRNEVSVNVDINYYQVTDHGEDENRVSGQGSMSMNFGWGSLEPIDNNDGVFKVSGFANPNGATKSAIDKLEKETSKFMTCYL